MTNPSIAVNQPPPLLPSWVTRRDTILLTLGSLLLAILSFTDVLPFSNAEVFGFISGAVCVWLVVLNSAWNFPVGIVNNIFFIYLFYHAALYADMGLQVWYILVSLFGIWTWMFGREQIRSAVKERLQAQPDGTTVHLAKGTKILERVPKPVTRVGSVEMWSVILAVLAFTVVMANYLSGFEGTVPLWDALTTGLSLGAFWLQCRRIVESWVLWIVADLIYIPLYFYKDLPLTGILYVVFLLMCVKGLTEWRKVAHA